MLRSARKRIRGRRAGSPACFQSIRFQRLWKSFQASWKAMKVLPVPVARVPGTALENDKTGEIIYTPPVGEALLRDLLANWERFLHETRELDPLIRMAVAHYQFEAIHPF